MSAAARQPCAIKSGEIDPAWLEAALERCRSKP